MGQSATPSQWYCSLDGKFYGPFNLETLHRLADFEYVGESDLIWTLGMPSWQPAAKLNGLFATPYPVEGSNIRILVCGLAQRFIKFGPWVASGIWAGEPKLETVLEYSGGAGLPRKLGHTSLAFTSYDEQETVITGKDAMFSQIPAGRRGQCDLDFFSERDDFEYIAYITVELDDMAIEDNEAFDEAYGFDENFELPEVSLPSNAPPLLPGGFDPAGGGWQGGAASPGAGGFQGFQTSPKSKMTRPRQPKKGNPLPIILGGVAVAVVLLPCLCAGLGAIVDGGGGNSSAYKEGYDEATHWVKEGSRTNRMVGGGYSAREQPDPEEIEEPGQSHLIWR